jgi:hypothetical protein
MRRESGGWAGRTRRNADSRRTTNGVKPLMDLDPELGGSAAISYRDQLP